MAHSIRIACTALVVAFTAGLGAAAVGSAVAGGAVADHSGARRTVIASGFDWDSAHPAPPAQS
ncbi:hypothetical protein EDD38_7143 [Kitasatospora cineracea]|uniref:Uncharacterized protein n=1 Tax=Kitasatospora cineracea TaxID=88074 RepID=A0A3N4R2S4_9ACTN|nr:hypothetical protein EDD38_7143 [Kitasatospora cineracea]